MSTLLPSELIIAVYRHTHWRDILRCRQVCKRFEGIVRESAELQYYVELAIAGLQDGGHIDLPFAVRLQKLRAQENAWWNLSWPQHTNLPQSGTTAAYDFHGGVWARGTGETYAGLSRKIEVSVLPSPWIQSGLNTTWTFEGLRDCRDFAIDPTQDLFVWIESDFVSTRPKIHICSLHTGEKHPLAQVSVISHSLVRNSGYIISICGSQLGILFESVELRIWDWRTGNVLRVQECIEELMTDFAFISQSPCHFIMAYPAENPPVIRLFSIDSVDPLATFELPAIEGGIDVHIRFRVDPPPPHHMAPLKDGPFTSKPFFITDEARILAISIWLVQDNDTERKFGVIMSMQTFLSRLPQQNLVVPWDSWSEETLWMATPEFVRDWIFYIYGTRYAAISASTDEENETDQDTKYYIEILDFNPLLARLLASGSYDQYRPPLTVESRLCGVSGSIDNDFFTFSYGSRLPYRITRTPIDKPQPLEVAIDDERLIILELWGAVGTTEIVSLSIHTP